MRHVLMFFILVSTSCTSTVSVEDAREVIRSHEAYTGAGDLDGVMSNAADDLVVLVPDAPLIEGKDAFREFYSGPLAMGRWEFVHEYDGAAVTGDAVVLHGVARGTVHRPGASQARLRITS